MVTSRFTRCKSLAPTSRFSSFLYVELYLQTLENRVDYPRIAFDAEELLKGDSSLTRLAVLIGKTKHPKKIMTTLD